MKTILGLFARLDDAKRIVRILRESGFSDEGMSILSREEIISKMDEFDFPGTDSPGLKENISNCAKELLGALAGLVISDQKVKIFSDGVKHGGALVIAHATNRKANAVKLTMVRHHAVEIQQIFPSIMSNPTTESEDMEPYVPLLWHQLHEA